MLVVEVLGSRIFELVHFSNCFCRIEKRQLVSVIDVSCIKNLGNAPCEQCVECVWFRWGVTIMKHDAVQMNV
jgi:hypothetical protein